MALIPSVILRTIELIGLELNTHTHTHTHRFYFELSLETNIVLYLIFSKTPHIGIKYIENNCQPSKIYFLEKKNEWIKWLPTDIPQGNIIQPIFYY